MLSSRERVKINGSKDPAKFSLLVQDAEDLCHAVVNVGSFCSTERLTTPVITGYHDFCSANEVGSRSLLLMGPIGMGLHT